MLAFIEQRDKCAESFLHISVSPIKRQDPDFLPSFVNSRSILDWFVSSVGPIIIYGQSGCKKERSMFVHRRNAQPCHELKNEKKRLLFPLTEHTHRSKAMQEKSSAQRSEVALCDLTIGQRSNGHSIGLPRLTILITR
jgi:hypothetical protein